MSRTKQIREMCIDFLTNQERATFHELRDHINTNTKHGTTSNQLSNILSNDIRFTQRGMISYSRKIGATGLNLSHKITTWSLSGVVE